MSKIYLSPSNQDGNLYAYGNTNEMEQCNRIAVCAAEHLTRNGYTVKRAPKGQKMNTSIKESNDWKADLHIPIHTNAGGGKALLSWCTENPPETQSMRSRSMTHYWQRLQRAAGTV